MFINFWYPAEESDAITREPRKVTMLGMHFVMWRDEAGKALCVANTCTHRGGSLADGIVVGDCVQCPYHGWLFNGEGHCERIPSLGPLSKIPERASIDAYPVDERYGLVFVFLGDLPEDERPTIMPCAEYDQEGWRVVRQRYTWKCNYVRLVENQSDPSHVEFVHGGFGFAGRDDNYRVPKIDIDKTEWGAGAMIQFYSPELPDQDMKDMQSEGTMKAGSGYHGIASTWTRVNFNETDRFYIYLYAVPRNEMELEIFLISTRNCRLDEQYNKNFLERIAIAVEEDRIVIEKLDPAIPSDEEVGEFIVPADDILMNYRQDRRGWQARGWRMDLRTARENANRMTYAIPGPARRGRPEGWAVTAVPLLEGESHACL